MSDGIISIMKLLVNECVEFVIQSYNYGWISIIDIINCWVCVQGSLEPAQNARSQQYCRYQYGAQRRGTSHQAIGIQNNGSGHQNRMAPSDGRWFYQAKMVRQSALEIQGTWRREASARQFGTSFRLAICVKRHAVSSTKLDCMEDSTQLWIEFLRR